MRRMLYAGLLVAILLVIAGCGSAASQDADSPPEPHIPQLVSCSPVAGSVVGRDASVVLTFDTPMDPASLQAAASFAPAARFSIFVSGNEAEFRPDCLLEKSTTYVFTLVAGALSSGGVALEAGTSLFFSTRADDTTLTVPVLGYVNTVIEGATADAVTAALGNGVGHYPGLGRPGGGNYVLFAHASGQISFPYNRLFDLQPGDEMILEYGGRSWVYRVQKGFVVADTELWILDQTDDPMITFFVCSAPEGRPSPTFHPPYRYVVRAHLIN